MQKDFFSFKNIQLPFYKKGEVFQWLIFSGTHGNEKDVVPFIEKYIADNYHQLPNFLYLPMVSPSAIEAGTRENKNGNDINRQFFDTTTDDEAQAVEAFLQGKIFSLLLDFHEDPERKEFYLYDSFEKPDEAVQKIFFEANALGISLFHGADDEGDVSLNNKIENGYYSYAHQGNKNIYGTSTEYVEEKGIVQGRVLTFEIPGLTGQELKDKMVSRILDVFYEHS